MSIDKVKQLIETAPEFKQWWESHREQIAQEFNGKQNWGRVIFASFGFYAAVFMPLVIWGSAQFKSNLSALGFNWFWFTLCVTLGSGLALSAVHSVWEGRLRLWPKKAPRPLQQFVNADDFMNKYGDIIPSADPINQKEIVEKMLFHPNVELQSHATDLLALKDMDLPHVWWRALEICVKNVETVQPPAQTAQEKLENVYVEMERIAKHKHYTVNQGLKL